MHDCRKTKTNLVDLVFGEMEASEQQRALAEVRSCPACSAEYHSMLATLRIFDQAADAAMPEESYWAGYEARLRVKLAEPVTPNWRERLAGWFAPLFAKPAMAAVAGLILLAAITAVWFSRQRNENPRVLVAGTTPTPQATPTIATPPQAGAPVGEIQPEQRSTVAVKVQQKRRPRSMEQPKEVSQDNLVAVNSALQEMSPGTPMVADPATHLENAQLLLRSFRNAREGETVNLAYEKRQARKLVYDNILLRREAEAKGNLPVEEALNSLEPLLLDIANLPAKASRGEVQTIRERIQKQEIIATLQIVGSGTERFGAPALMNQE
jgi:hypothetical protein